MPKEDGGDLTAEAMLAAAAKFDNEVAGGVAEPELEVEEQPQPEEPDEGTEDSEKAEPEPEEPQDTDDEPPPEDDAEPEVTDLEEGQPPSEPEKSDKKSKFAKNEERKSKAWKDINSRKEELKLKEEELSRQRDALEKERMNVKEGQEYRDERGLSATDYDNAAEGYREEGDTRLAIVADKMASDLRKKEAEAKESAERKKAQSVWNETRASLEEKYPELKDPDASLTRAANEILNQYPLLGRFPNGLKYAVDGALLKLKANDSSADKARIKELTAKLKKYEKKMSVGGGFSPEKPSGERGFDDLSMEEQEARLRKAAGEFDNAL